MTKGIFLAQVDAARADQFKQMLEVELPHLEIVTDLESAKAATVHYALTMRDIPNLGARFPNLKLLFSLGAGVDQIDLSTLPKSTQIVRMTEPGIKTKMSEYIVMSVLMLHRSMLAIIEKQQHKALDMFGPVPSAKDRCIGVMGLGQLGAESLKKLHQFGFPLAGWSRSHKNIPGVKTFAGPSELNAFLSQTDILICLLPLTSETSGILNAELFAQLPKGASLVHAGRGQHLDHEALLATLDSGHMSGAILDVTDPEPLPSAHPFWDHPNIILTGHIASRTDPLGAVKQIARTMRRFQAGLPLEGVVEKERGY